MTKIFQNITMIFSIWDSNYQHIWNCTIFPFLEHLWNAKYLLLILAHFVSQDENLKNNVVLSSSNSKMDSSNNENIDSATKINNCSSLLPTQHSSRSLTNLNFASSQRVTYRRLEKIASYHYLPRVVYHGSLKKSQSHHR